MLMLYSAGHFAVDFLCAWLVLGRFSGAADWVTLALLYNFCAFALQMPLGILADRLGRCRMFSALGAGLVLLGLLPLGVGSVLLAGLGNAFYHVGGGRETLLNGRGYGALGIFVSPGALGIFLGSLLRGRLLWGWLGGALLALCGLAICVMARRECFAAGQLQMPKQPFRLLALFLVVLLRSLLGMCLATPWKTGIWVILGAVLGALGKAAGGIAGDRLGGRRAAAISLLAAGVLLLLPASPAAGVSAGFLVQISMPITLRDSASLCPGGEGFVFGLMTFALFLGFLPAQWGLSLVGLAAAAPAAVSAVLLYFAAGRDRQ